MPPSMSDKQAPDLEDSGLTEQEATEAGVFGVDAKGRKHRFHRGTATIIVTRGDDVVHTEQLSRENVPQWIDFVTDAAGWDQVWWSTEDLGEQMSQSMATHRTAKEMVCDGGQEP